MAEEPLHSLTQLRQDLDRFRAAVDEQKRQDMEHRKMLEDELLLTQQRLADAEQKLQSNNAPSQPTPSSQRPPPDDPFLPASERHRLSRNPQPEIPPQTPWSRWNPLHYLRTPFLENDGSFEFRRPRATSPSRRARAASTSRAANIPGAFLDSPSGTAPRDRRHVLLRGGAPTGGDGHGSADAPDNDIPDVPDDLPTGTDTHAQRATHHSGGVDHREPRRFPPNAPPDTRFHGARPRHDYPDHGFHRSGDYDYDCDSRERRSFTREDQRSGSGPKLKPEDISTFDGENVEFFIASCLSFAALYGERRVLEVVPRALKGVAKDWFLTVPAHKRHHMSSLQGWAYLLRDGFGEDERRSRERAEARFFDPSKESFERYFWDKKQMHERAEPGISELHLMREIWKGLAPKTPWL